MKAIVELHGGRAEVRSEGLGRGCEFRVSLPLATAPVHAGIGDDVGELRRTTPASARRVLVVDDNIDSTEMMAALLEMHGHTVWIAHDA